MSALALLAFGALAAVPPDCEPTVAQAARELEDAVVALRGELEELPRGALRRRVRLHLDQIRKKQTRLLRIACVPLAAPPAPPVEVDRGPAGGPTDAPFLSRPDFRALVSALRGESFDDARLALLEAGLVGRCVRAKDTAALIGAFTFSAGRKSVAKLIVPRVLPRHRAARAAEVFRLSADREAYLAMVRDLPAAPGCGPSPNADGTAPPAGPPPRP